MGLAYVEKDEGIEFVYLGVHCSVDNDKKISLDEKLFGYIPHVMENGMLCTTGNNLIQLQESELNHFDMALDVYLPWLISLDPALKVAEILNEIEYYLIKKTRCSVKFEERPPDSFTSLSVTEPISLWEKIFDFDENSWYELYPIQKRQYSIFIKKSKNINEYSICHNNTLKASQRVLGLDFEDFNQSVCLIGIGSVNSYIIKNLLAHNTKYLTVIDDDKIEKGNAFRYAFPYEGVYKVEAVRKFARLFDKKIVVRKKRKRVMEDTENYILDSNYVFISVDDPFSWFDTILYAIRNCKKHSILVLIGIDAFGNYAKYMIIKMSQTKNAIVEKVLEFITYRDPKYSRSEMVGNGCGKSMSVYNEKSLISISEEVVNSLIKIANWERVNVIDMQL